MNTPKPKRPRWGMPYIGTMDAITMADVLMGRTRVLKHNAKRKPRHR